MRKRTARIALDVAADSAEGAAVAVAAHRRTGVGSIFACCGNCETITICGWLSELREPAWHEVQTELPCEPE